MPPMSRRRPGAPPTSQTYHIPAPTGGVNTVAAGLSMPASDCVSSVNLIGAENGLRARLGWREWRTGLEGIVAPDVRSLLPFSGSIPINNRLFATTDAGIYNVTASGTAPTRMVNFPATAGPSGYGVSAVMVTTAGHFLLYCDEVNGLYVYAGDGGTWTKVAMGGGANQIAGLDPTRAAFVAVFKNRVWLVEKDTSNAWYLPVGQVYGTATKFPLGTVFREGGFLVGLWNWTYDGGAGIDDSLVAVSSAGDVLIYQGTDPSSSTAFGLRGVWQIGAPPTGRRIASTYGGDLLLLSRQGLVPVSRLVVGAAGAIEYATAKISNLINRLMLERSTQRDWGVLLQPEDNALIVLVPMGTDGLHVQLAQSNASRGWFPYDGLPILSAAVWGGRFYFGTRDGRVCIHTGYLDELLLDGMTFRSVPWSLQTGYSNLGMPRHKRVNMLRPLILTDTARPAFSIAACYDYQHEVLETPELVAADGYIWDDAVWDDALWGGGDIATNEVRGAAGAGVDVGVALSGASVGRTVLVGIDVAYTPGGFL